jgi:hypothetical protein
MEKDSIPLIEKQIPKQKMSLSEKEIYHHTYYEALLKLLMNFPQFPNKRNKGYWGAAELSRKVGLSYVVVKRLLIMISIIQQYADFLDIMMVGRRVYARVKPSEMLNPSKLVKVAKELGEKRLDMHYAKMVAAEKKEQEEKTNV